MLVIRLIELKLEPGSSERVNFPLNHSSYIFACNKQIPNITSLYYMEHDYRKFNECTLSWILKKDVL